MITKRQLNICIIVPENNVYSETFIRAHIDRLPGKVTFLYGGLFPTRQADGRLLVPEPSFLERTKRSLLYRLFKINFSEDLLKHKILQQFLISNKIDLVLAEYGPTGARVMNVCQKANIALIVHFHGFDAYEKNTLKDFGNQYLEMFKIAAAIVSVSTHMRQVLINMGAPADKVHTNPCGMNAQLFSAANPEKAPPTFLSVGRFVEKKAPHLTLLAFKKVSTKIPEAKLVMAGDGPLLDACKTMTKALKLENAVQFLGTQTPEQNCSMDAAG